jgi:hypothetical protein
MRRIIALVTLVTLLSGCAHDDLKAPCPNVASLTSGSIPCDQHVPVNAKIVPSAFAQ